METIQKRNVDGLDQMEVVDVREIVIFGTV